MRFFNVENSLDYYSFGMLIPERFSSSSDYRYGYGGHEKDDEVSGKGNHLAFGDYGYNPRLARRFQIDPMIGTFPWMSPYAVFNNNPIYFIDPTGMSPEESDGWIKNNKTGEVHWDNEVNSEEDFEKSNYNKVENSYLGQEFDLPDGSGSITVLQWDTFGDLETDSPKESIGPMIEVEFTPKNNGQGIKNQTNWVQTVYINWVDYEEFQNNNSPAKVLDEPVEMVDNIMSFDPKNSWYYDPTYSKGTPVPTESINSFDDQPGRGKANIPVIFRAQSSLVKKQADAHAILITLNWGFVIMPSGKVNYEGIKINNTVTPFHQEAVDNLPK